ncbi:hypothetical protein F5883DRAFT_41840 [Diaporthe sp. PMI_573]|nr:hypothetical protein F5883DRAFT_41840 [Diaporthaceae sp. PMI_573]
MVSGLRTNLDAEIIAICQVLRSWYRAGIIKDLDPLLKSHLESKPSLMHRKFQDTSTKRLDGTCDWVIHHEAFRKWYESQDSTILSLCGSMGTGKTYATSRVVDWIASSLEESNYDEAFAYHYCSKKNTYPSKPTAILRSIVRQVATRLWNRRKDIIALDESVIEIWNRHQEGRHFYNTFDEWKDCLFKLLSKYPRITVVLDALDECEEDDQEILVKFFNSLVTRSTKDSNVKIFVSTRDERGLSQLLNQHPAILMHKGHTAEDIAVFVREKVQQHSEWLHMNRELQDHILKTLVKDSQDMFLFAKVQIESLRQYSDEGDIRRALKKLPETLRVTYDEIYQIATKIPGNKRLVDSALRCVVRFAKPLTTDELLLAITNDSDSNVDTANERDIKTWCNNLLRLEASSDDSYEGRLVWRLAHQAVAASLENRMNLGIENHTFKQKHIGVDPNVSS